MTLSQSQWEGFNHAAFLAKPRVEPMFSHSDSNPIVTIPPMPPTIGDANGEVFARSAANLTSWHTQQPSHDEWLAVWDAVKNYIEYVVVAVLDTGCNPHEILPAPLDEVSMVDGQGPRDGNGHGTAVASCSVGNDQRTGWACGAQHVVVKVLSDQGSGSSSWIAGGLEWCNDWKASDGLVIDVINGSFGSRAGTPPHQRSVDAVQRAFSLGKLCNFAAGNDGPSPNTIGPPASSPACPAIGATREDGNVAGFSSRGEQLYLATPGQNIIAAHYASMNGMRSVNGTSFASPLKAGLDALLISLWRAHGRPQWRSLAEVSAIYTNPRYLIDRGAPGHDPSYGHGVPNVPLLVQDMARYGRKFFKKALA